MPEQDPKIQELEDRLDALVRTQIDFQKEISLIRGELVRLRARKMMSEQDRPKPSLYAPIERSTPTQPAGSTGQPPITQPPQPQIQQPPGQSTTQPPRQPPPTPPASTPPPTIPPQRPPLRAQANDPGYVLPKRTPYESGPVLSDSTVTGDSFSRFATQYSENARANLEKFIGQNLISLIGIVVLILGVGIGAKYAIDNNLISPLTRIIIGYIFGFGLVGLAIKLRRTYEAFSAVLISGGMAIMYFVTYFAYAAYALIPQLPTFGLMVMFTGFTVAAALVYNRQVIAHIGLVGAYAVPFLLSNDSGNYLALFIYMAVINAGILAVSLKKEWKPIFYTASFFTWTIFGAWFITKYSSQEHFQLALVFLAVYFAILYATKLVHTGFAREEEDRTENLVSSMITTGIFYALCYAIVIKGPLEPVRYWTFFTYLTVASLAIIATSLKFHKHPFVVHAPWGFAWAVFCGWFAMVYSHQEYFTLALIFMGVFFAISYGATLLQARLLEDEADRKGNVFAAVLTGFVFYALCFVIVNDPLVESPQYWTLFTYIAVASGLIIATSFKFFDRVLVYLVVPFTWAIYGAWFVMRYDPTQQFQLAAVFASLFFAIFYLSILFHRLVEDNFTLVEHASLVLSNAFLFYGFGYLLLDRHEVLRDYLGLYTAANAILHLTVALGIRALAPKAVDIVQVLTVLILTFASIAVPVQFDGNVVTMAWAAEGAILFWLGRTRGIGLFEKFSYPVMLLATASLGLEWVSAYGNRLNGSGNAVTPFINSDFITAVVFVAASALIYFTNRDPKHEPALGSDMVRPFGIVTAVAGSIVLYNMFRMEIGNYFYLMSVNVRGDRPMPVGPVGNLQLFNVAWQIDYTLLFLSAMAVINLKALRSTSLALVNGVLAVLALAIFATVNMFLFNELRMVFVSGGFNPDVVSHWLYVAIRPISYGLAAVLLYVLYEYSRDSLLEDRIDRTALIYGFDAIAYTFVFIVASGELLNLMGQIGIPDATKLGLSILWGVYALAMVVIGIAKDKKHLRIAAFVLLFVTLAKLFFYDISELGTIPKTILFVTLGITLLLVSFLYNKYKNVIFKADVSQD